MLKFVKRHLSPLSVAAVFRYYRRLIKYYVFSLSLSYSTCFPTVVVCSTGPPPIGIVDLNLRYRYDDIPLPTYNIHTNTYTHFPSLFPHQLLTIQLMIDYTVETLC